MERFKRKQKLHHFKYFYYMLHIGKF